MSWLSLDQGEELRTHMKKVIVTGGAGFVGSHLVERLVKRNEQVVVWMISQQGDVKI